MSWSARRYIPGKPVIRAIRHRKKILSKAESDALRYQPPAHHEIASALSFAVNHKLDRLVAILSLAGSHDVVEKHNAHLLKEIDKLEIECGNWKFKYLLERQKVLALQAKIGSLRRHRQSSRTRMRAGAFTTRSTYPSSKR